jgi:transposase
VVATYAPVGETPVLSHTLTRDHLSAISGITPEGQLFLQVQESAFDSAGCIGFLEQLQQQIPGNLLILWDGAPIHRSKAVQAYLSQGGAKRLWLERLPGYAPELNPDEGVWRYLKYVELKNLCCRDLAHLREELDQAAARLGNRPDLIQACFDQVGYI